jgi:predicted MFS family arabinose efflux permease
VANLVLPLFGWKAVYMLFAVICLFSLLLLMVFEEKPKITKKAGGEDVEAYYKLMVATKQDSNKAIYKSSDSERKKL